MLLDIFYSSLIDSLQNELRSGIFLLSRLVSERGLAPRGHRTGVSYGALSFAAAVRVVVGVHDDRGP